MAPWDTARQARAPAVLIVEDAEDTRDLWMLAFQDAGFRVLVADSLAAGIATLRDGEAVDVVVCDYWLGDGTGDALLREATQEGKLGEGRALICTAYHSVTDSPHAPVLHKPIAPDDLIARVRELPGLASVSSVA